MEEDVKRIEYILEFSQKTGIHYALETDDLKALENVLAENKRLREECANKDLVARMHISKDKIKKIKAREEGKVHYLGVDANEFEKISVWKHAGASEVLEELLEENI